MTQTILPVILCGGMGSRLWPLSRKHYPKQFLTLGDSEHSLLQDTVLRLTNAGTLPPVIITNEDHRFLVAEHMRAINTECHIILEPEGRSTAPAIAAAALYGEQSHAGAHLLVLPSDHMITDQAAFTDAVQKAAKAADAGYLATFGITPEYAETGYGYIQKGDAVSGTDALKVAAFVEKPSRDVAEDYVKSGDYAWNSGMFMFPCAALLEELQQYEPEILTQVRAAMDAGQADADFFRLDGQAFGQAKAISIDYAVMERTQKAVTIPVSCGWSDAGAWDSLWRVGEKDDHNNVVKGSALLRDTKNSYIRADGDQTVAALGLDNMVVVSTPDMILVADQAQAQSVRDLMDDAAKQNAAWVDHQSRVFRPWGYYETIQMGSNYQVKHIQVKPGARLSIQMHHHRAEHWVMTSGQAKILLGKDEKDLKEHNLKDNDYIYIPLGDVHCIENTGTEPLDFIEVQHGGYLGEDDIVRFDDRYGRVEKKSAA